MQIDAIREHCLSKPDVTEGFPFGEGALVFKTSGKIFALLMLDEVPTSMNLKCDPARALKLRDQYEWIRPGYHMNKKHWNTMVLESGVSPDLVRELIDHSYNLVCRKENRQSQ
jgi:predicted DNA-binding protein (MmcQ/YjbR family)